MNLLFRLKRYIKTPETKKEYPMINRLYEGYSKKQFRDLTISNDDSIKCGATFVTYSNKNFNETASIEKQNFENATYINYSPKLYRNINGVTMDNEFQQYYTKKITEYMIEYNKSHESNGITKTYICNRNSDLLIFKKYWCGISTDPTAQNICVYTINTGEMTITRYTMNKIYKIKYDCRFNTFKSQTLKYHRLNNIQIELIFNGKNITKFSIYHENPNVITYYVEV